MSHFQANCETVAADLSWLTPQLAIGSRLDDRCVPHAAQVLGIRRVVDVRSEMRPSRELLKQHGIAVLHLPTADLHPVTSVMIWRGVHWVSEGIGRGEKVLIHCHYGIGRSALLACCVLVDQGLSPLCAWETAKRARRIVSPTPEQIHAFLDWVDNWRDVRGHECGRACWDEIADVVYRGITGNPS